MLKVLFAGFKYEYGRPSWGLSHIEYQNFFGTLRQMPNLAASFFAVDEIMLKDGREEMNRQLIAQVQELKPDLLFTMIFQEEIRKETVKFITQKINTKTFNWFTDDHWRLPVFSRYFAPLFTAVGTTDSQAPEKYRALGITNVLKTQWGVNHYLYQPVGKSENRKIGNYDITFVGKNYGKRGGYIKNLQKQNLPAVGFGKGWESGTVDFRKMLEIFSFSKVNLNFTESPYMTVGGRAKVVAKLFVKKELGQYKFDAHHIVDNFKSALGTQRRQIKGRTFEVPACGGFLLTGDADNLADYYIPGKEIAVFKNKQDLVERCKYYLSHEEERQTIAKAGFERTIKEHTYEHRFKEIFKAMGLM